MDKEQQIEEMANITYDKIKKGFGAKFKDIAEAIYNAGYRKIDENCAVITKAELKEYKRQAVKEFAERLKKEPRINNYGLEFVALVDIDAELKELLKEYEE